MSADDDDVPLLNEDDDDAQLLTVDDRPPHVEAVFVATFDIKSGNTLEFQMPEEALISLNGVEHKAIPSGSHNINQDFVYFRHQNKYGLACVARANLTNEDDGSALSVVDHSQRGMCIKSVGIVTSSIIHIQSYLSFLQTEAKIYLNQSSVNYDRLKGLLVQHESPTVIGTSFYDAQFTEFLQYFGPSIFPLSKLMLLGKRILLYSRSPIGLLCNAVYFTHFLNSSVNSLFFVTIMDLFMLNNERSYIACTTEKILKDKTSIYDVFIDCDAQAIFHTTDPVLRSITQVTRHDRNCWKKTITLNSFMNIGNRLSRLMDRLSKSNTGSHMTKEDFHSVDLHSRDDRLFINEYIRIHHIPNVTISNPNATLFLLPPCCPCSHPN